LIPEGTQVEIQLTASKPITSALVSRNGEQARNVEKLENETIFAQIDDLRADTFLEWTIEDDFGIKNRKPIRLDLELLKDQSPSVLAKLDGIGSAITPIALLPVQGNATDDNGLAKIDFRYSSTKSKPDEKNKAENTKENESESGNGKEDESAENQNTSPSGEGSIKIAELNGTITNQPLSCEFSVAELLLQPGDRLMLTVEATDTYNLNGSTGNVAVGDRWNLEIVSAQQLKGILEAREIGLRQRFEALIDEVRRTRSIITDISFPAAPEDAEKKSSDENTENTSSNNGNNTENKEENTAGNTSANKTEDNSENATPEKSDENKNNLEPKKPKFDRITDEQAAAGNYGISRAIRDSEKEKYELQGINAGFSSIRKEMVNNQIFTPDQQQRIDNQIMEPIKTLIERDFYEFEQILGDFTQAIEKRDQTARPEILKQRDRAISQLDKILTKMAAIRDQMVSMETFNEAIEMLREIIKGQESLREETTQKRKEQLRSLLD
ncbi:MAG: hypothetical protein ACRC2T_06720, partial [Thermoguttaceae bacterium]